MKSTGSKMTCMDIQLERAAETLNQGDGACVSSRFYITGFSGQVRSNGAVDNPQRLTHSILPPATYLHPCRQKNPGIIPGPVAEVLLL